MPISLSIIEGCALSPRDKLAYRIWLMAYASLVRSMRHRLSAICQSHAPASEVSLSSLHSEFFSKLLVTAVLFRWYCYASISSQGEKLSGRA